MNTAAPQNLSPVSEKISARFDPDENWGSPLVLYRALQDSLLSIWTKDTFSEPMVLKKSVIADILFLSDPDGIRHVLMDNIDNYPKSPLQQRFLKPSLGEGLFTAEGEKWRMQRHAANPSFRAEQLSTLVPALLRGLDVRLSTWRHLPEDKPINIHSEMMQLTLELLCQSMFSGIDVDRKALGDAVTFYVETVGRIDILDFLSLPEWLPSPKLRKAQWSIDHLHSETARIVNERRAQSNKPQDLLTMLIEARDEKTGQGLSEQQLRDSLATLLSAGHETTANAMTMTLYLLTEFPWAAQKIREEVENVLGDRVPTARDLMNLKFTRMVIEESLRLYPPSSILIRVAAKDDVICGQKIRKGTTVAISQYVLHRHEKLWEKPDVFDPYRFSPENRSGRHRFAYLPFSVGPRSCIGSTFAMMELTLALATIARDFDLTRVDNNPVELQLKITLRLKNELLMQIRPRRAA